jgi:O-antigen ligase
MTWYDYANTTTFSDWPHVLNYIDNAAGTGVFGFLLLLLLMAVAFRGSESLTFEKRLLASLLVGTITSVLLTAAGLLGTFWSPTLVVLTFIALVSVNRRE